MSTKNTGTKVTKTSDATKTVTPAKAETKAAAAKPAAVAPAPVQAQATTPAKAETTKTSVKVTKGKAKEPVVEAPVEPPVEETERAEGEAEAEAEAEVEGEGKAKKRRQRPRQRAFDEIYPEMVALMDSSYKDLQLARKLMNQLLTSHKKSVTSSKTHQNVTRTPTILFDQALVDYFLSRLEANELCVHRRTNGTDEEVSLADLSTETRVHRTDVTQLFTKVFKKHSMLSTDDGRVILYGNDADLVNLLTTGEYDPKYQGDVDAIKAGTHKLTIFNIQRVTSQHLGKIDKPAKATQEEQEQ